MTSPKNKNKTEKRLETLAVKTKKQKQAFLEQLLKYPIVQVACERSGMGRSTYYVWRKDDKEFAKQADKSMESGANFINDMAESKLIQNIQNSNNTAIIFWLKNHHHSYNDRVHHEHELVETELSPEHRVAIAKSLFNAGFMTKFGRNAMIKSAGGIPPPDVPGEDDLMKDTLEKVYKMQKEQENELSPAARFALTEKGEGQKERKDLSITEFLARRNKKEGEK